LRLGEISNIIKGKIMSRLILEDINDLIEESVRKDVVAGLTGGVGAVWGFLIKKQIDLSDKIKEAASVVKDLEIQDKQLDKQMKIANTQIGDTVTQLDSLRNIKNTTQINVELVKLKGNWISRLNPFKENQIERYSNNIEELKDKVAELKQLKVNTAEIVDRAEKIKKLSPSDFDWKDQLGPLFSERGRLGARSAYDKMFGKTITDSEYTDRMRLLDKAIRDNEKLLNHANVKIEHLERMSDMVNDDSFFGEMFEDRTNISELNKGMRDKISELKDSMADVDSKKEILGNAKRNLHMLEDQMDNFFSNIDGSTVGYIAAAGVTTGLIGRAAWKFIRGQK
jgi:hypothetical protein